MSVATVCKAEGRQLNLSFMFGSVDPQGRVREHTANATNSVHVEASPFAKEAVFPTSSSITATNSPGAHHACRTNLHASVHSFCCWQRRNPRQLHTLFCRQYIQKKSWLLRFLLASMQAHADQGVCRPGRASSQPPGVLSQSQLLHTPTWLPHFLDLADLNRGA